MPDKTRKPLFPNWERKKHLFEKNFRFFFGKYRIEPKNVRRGTLGVLLTYILLQAKGHCKSRAYFAKRNAPTKKGRKMFKNGAQIFRFSSFCLWSLHPTGINVGLKRP